MKYGPSKNSSGDVVSSALNFRPPKDAAKELRNSFSLLAGQIQAVHTIDSSENDSDGKYTLYDVLVYHPNGSTELLTKCLAAQPVFGGGINNFLETTTTDPGFDAKNFNKGRATKRGHQVLVGFISGYKNSGIIIGSIPHSSPVSVAKRPTKSQGNVTQGEIQGLGLQVTNDGELIVTFNGPRDDKGELTGDAGPTEIKIDKQGNVEVSTNEDQTVKIDRVNKKITLHNNSTDVIMDDGSKKIQVQAKTVEVGKGALQPMVVGDDWKLIMAMLIDAITQIVVPTGVGPSGNPVNNNQFLAIKAILDQALSRNHKVEK